MVKVRNMTSPRSNKPFTNQFIIETPDGEYFQSYQSVIAFKPSNIRTKQGVKIVLDERYHDYSSTTVKYRNQLLNMTSQQVKEAIARREIRLGNLNK